MQACGFWLASGKKRRMALGDPSLIWIQALSLESEGTSPSVVSDSFRLHRLWIHGIMQTKILEWAAFPISRGSSNPRG